MVEDNHRNIFNPTFSKSLRLTSAYSITAVSSYGNCMSQD